jgi:hypothetical protein
MTEHSTAPQGADDDRSGQRGEAAPEASSPLVDTGGEQADDEGRHVEEDVEDNADLDG